MMAESFPTRSGWRAVFLKLTPLRIAVLYGIMGGLWILSSDEALSGLGFDPKTFVLVEMLKGWVYVGFTACLLFLMIRRFEKTHLESEHQYRALLEQASDGIFIFDKQGNYLVVNALGCQLLGYTEKELLKLNVKDAFPPEDLLAQPMRLEEMRAGKTVLSDRRLRRKDGVLLPVEISAKMLKNGRFFAIVRNVSEHRKKDEMLALRSRQLELLLNSNRQVNTVLEIPVVMRTLVQTAMALTGATSGIAGIMSNGKMMFQEFNQRGALIPFEYAYGPGNGIPGRIMETGKPYISNDARNDAVVTPEILEKLGFYNFAAVPIFDRTDKLLGCFIVHDKAGRLPFTADDTELLEGLAAGAAVALENAQLLAEHRRVEASLREGEKKFRMLAENAAVAIFIYQGAALRYFNSMTEKLTGYTREELLQLSVRDLIHPEYRHEIRDNSVARDGEEKRSSRREFKIVTKSGEERWVDFTSGTIEFDGQPASLGTAYDITERKKLEEQFRQAHKMEAVGLLAGGVAHDFNNILTAITGYGHLAKMKLMRDDAVVPYIDQILSSAERAANLTHSLLAFSRKQLINRRPVNINEIIAGVGKLLARLIGEDIELKMDLDGRTLMIFADTGQIEQVLMNLATNARDAMNGGGTLTIKTEQVDMDQEFIAGHGYGSRGTYALLTVADTGAGMDGLTQARIFEPFYTTKEQGKGTGLGLSTAYGIIKQHEGFITVYSEPGMGASFDIYLPLVQSIAGDVPALRPVEALGGAETVLLAEDDEAVRRFAVTLLTDAGYNVIDAPDGEQAVKKFQEHGDEIKLLIFDVIMPRMNGKDAYEEIRKSRPDVKVLFMSGYAADVFEKKKSFGEGLTLMAKPIAPLEFLKTIRETLDR